MGTIISTDKEYRREGRPIIIPLPPAQEKIEPERLAKFPPASTLREAVLLLARLARDPAFLDARLALLEEARRAEDWYLARSYEALDHSCSLQVFVWPYETATLSHDHATWGAYRCAVGSVLERSATSVSTTAP